MITTQQPSTKVAADPDGAFDDCHVDDVIVVNFAVHRICRLAEIGQR